MKKILPLATLLLTIITISSCISLKPFRHSMKRELDSLEFDLTKVQFYNRHAIKLERVLTMDEVKSVKGTVNFVNGKYYHEIIIKNETPCVIEKIDEDSNIIYVRFEEGDNRYLAFKLVDNVYKLQMGPAYRGGVLGQISYDNSQYDVLVGKDAYLAIKRSDKLIEKKETKVLKGMKVD